MSDTIFGKIIRGEIPAERVYEDDHCIVINDISPQAPIHRLVIPKQAIAKLCDANEDHRALLGHLMWVAAKVANDTGIGDACRFVINNGEGGGQTVFHLHIHVLGGIEMSEQTL